MNLSFKASSIAVLTAALIQAPGYGQGTDFESFPMEGQTLWHQVLSPNNNEILATINNCPFSFESSSKFERDQRKAEPILDQALAVARQYETQLPRDLVECLINVGSFNFIAGHTTVADQYFTEAVAVADKHTVHDSLLMAGLLDQAGLVARSAHDYKRAYALYLRALKIRRSFVDDKHPDVSHSLMNLASLCRDRALVEGERWQKEAEALELQIDSLRQHGEFISADLTNHRPRPFVPDLAINKGSSMLPRMVAFAQSIVDKHRKPIILTQPEPGLGTIVGKWTVPSDVVVEQIDKVSHSSEEKIDGRFEVTKTRRETASPLENIAIYLVRQTDQSKIWRAVEYYASLKGLSMSKFCSSESEGWPATLKQAVAVKDAADSVAESLAVKTARTDKNGDYEIEGVPKGTYILYASLATSRHALMWMLPSAGTITVSRLCQVKQNFPEQRAVILFDANQDFSPVRNLNPGRVHSVMPAPYLVAPPSP